MVDFYPYIKALHLIFVITWFAGLFYIVRLFVYQIEAYHKPQPEKEILGKQLKLMAQRLWYIITWPSMLLAVSCGITMLLFRPFYLADTWMQIKLGFVLLLVAYHLFCHRFYKKLQRDEVSYSTQFMRIFNEGATLVLFAVIFIMNFRYTMHWLYGLIGLILLAVLLMLGIRLYKRIRKRND